MNPRDARKYKFPLVEVTWVDSSTINGWRSELSLDMKAPLTCWSAGYLLHKDNRSVVVALNVTSVTSANDYGDAIVIPRANVKKIRQLR